MHINREKGGSGEKKKKKKKNPTRFELAIDGVRESEALYSH